jgi:hypothetical protein
LNQLPFSCVEINRVTRLLGSLNLPRFGELRSGFSAAANIWQRITFALKSALLRKVENLLAVSYFGNLIRL